MKTFFSEYRYLPKLRHFRVKEPLSDDLINRLWVNAIGSDELLEPSAWTETAIGLSELLILNGKGMDYFIETPELCDLLVGMVKDFTADVLSVFHDIRHSAIVIHPVTPRPAVLVGMHTIADNTIVALSENGSENSQCITLWPRSFSEKNRIYPLGYADKLAVGLALYLRFFPQAARDGIPEIAKHPAHYKGKRCSTVGMAEELMDRRGVKPHIRQAHFRFLGSEAFTKKRNTYVLVKGSFVRGKCRIVVEVEGPEVQEVGS